MPAPLVTRYALCYGENGTERIFEETFINPDKYNYRLQQLRGYFEEKEITFVHALRYSFIPGTAATEVHTILSLWHEPKPKRELNVPIPGAFA